MTAGDEARETAAYHDRFAAPPPPGPAGRDGFPRPSARSPTGRDDRRPKGFDGVRNPRRIGFEMRHQEPIDSWLGAMPPRLAARPELRLSEPVPISRSLPPTRPIIDGGMVRGIPDEAVRARTPTASRDRQPAPAALGPPVTRHPAVALVGRRRCFSWWRRGAPDAAAPAALADALRHGR